MIIGGNLLRWLSAGRMYKRQIKLPLSGKCFIFTDAVHECFLSCIIYRLFIDNTSGNGGS